MATRSTIAIAREDGTVAKVYCHWDGYLENNGQLLVNCYNTAEKIEELLSHGDISSLGEVVGGRHPFGPDYNNPGSPEDVAHRNAKNAGWTTFYGRDRGESDIDAKVYADIESYENSQFEEFNYLFIGGKWYYKSYDKQVREVEVMLSKLKEAESA